MLISNLGVLASLTLMSCLLSLDLILEWPPFRETPAHSGERTWVLSTPEPAAEADYLPDPLRTWAFRWGRFLRLYKFKLIFWVFRRFYYSGLFCMDAYIFQACVWSSEGNFQGSALPFFLVSPKDGTWLARLGGKRLSRLSCLASPPVHSSELYVVVITLRHQKRLKYYYLCFWRSIWLQSWRTRIFESQAEFVALPWCWWAVGL